VVLGHTDVLVHVEDSCARPVDVVTLAHGAGEAELGVAGGQYYRDLVLRREPDSAARANCSAPIWLSSSSVVTMETLNSPYLRFSIETSSFRRGILGRTSGATHHLGRRATFHAYPYELWT